MFSTLKSFFGRREKDKKPLPVAVPCREQAGPSDQALREAVLILILKHQQVCAPFETFTYDMHNVHYIEEENGKAKAPPKALGSFRVVVLPVRQDAITESPMDSEH